MNFIKKFFSKNINKKAGQKKHKEKKHTHLHKHFIAVAILLIAVLCLRPLLSSGWIADDASHSLAGFVAKWNDTSLKERFISYFVAGPGVIGRFFPLAGYAFLLFTLFPNVVLYKSIVLCVVLFCIFLFYKLIKRLSGNEHISLLACVIMPAFFQFRFFYDPILYGSAIIPLIFSLTFLSLLFLDKFLETRKWKFYTLSVLTYLISLLTYEITYVFFLLHLSFIYFRKHNLREVIRYGTAFVVALSIAVIGSIYERAKYGSAIVAAYKIEFVPHLYFLTVLKQLYAALPFSYSLSNPAKIFPQTLRDRLFLIRPLDLVVVTLFLICYLYLIKKSKLLSATARKKFLIVGLLLFILPSLMTALSITSQQLLVFGLGYMPVFIQYFGVCLFLIAIAAYVTTAVGSVLVKQFLSICMAIVLSLIYLVNLQNNRFIVEQFNKAFWYPRNVLEVSAKHGLFKEVPENATLIMETDDGLSLDYQFFVYSLTNRKIFAINSKGIASWYKDVAKLSSAPPLGASEKYFIDKGPVHFYRYWSNSIRQGYVVVSKVSDFRVYPDFKKTPVKTKNLDVFVLGDLKSEANISFSKISLDMEGNVESQFVIKILKSKFKILQKSKKGTVVRIPVQLDSGNWIDFQSIRFNPTSEPPYFISLCDTDACLKDAPVDLSYIEMGNSLYEDTLLLEGWSTAEENHRWANSLNSTLRLVKHGNVQFLQIEARALVENQTMSIYSNDELIKTQELGTEWGIYKIPLVYSNYEGLYKIKFVFTKITTPAELGISTDARELTADFKKIALE